MKSHRAEFVRRMGCLSIRLEHLNDALRRNDTSAIEREAAAVQDELSDLVRLQGRLSRDELASLRPRFAGFRERAMRSLEIAQRILDDSLAAMQALVKSVQDSNHYGDPPPGNPFMIDRRA